MLHLTEETKVFDILFYVKSTQRLSVSNLISLNEFIVSDTCMDEILRFPRKFFYQNVDYAKLNNIQM